MERRSFVRYLTLMIVGCVVADTAAVTEANDEDAHGLCTHYRKTCEHILRQVHSGHIDAASVQRDAEDLIATATKICKLYEAHHPEAKELMEFVIHESDHIKRMSLADLKTQWHDGDVYQVHDVGFDMHDARKAHYMWPAEALIHPATVTTLAFQGYIDLRPTERQASHANVTRCDSKADLPTDRPLTLRPSNRSRQRRAGKKVGGTGTPGHRDSRRERGANSLRANRESGVRAALSRGTGLQGGLQEPVAKSRPASRAVASLAKVVMA